MDKKTYLVVTSADGTVVRVFPESKRAEASALARTLSRPGTTYYADAVSRSKTPRIGGRA